MKKGREEPWGGEREREREEKETHLKPSRFVVERHQLVGHIIITAVAGVGTTAVEERVGPQLERDPPHATPDPVDRGVPPGTRATLPYEPGVVVEEVAYVVRELTELSVLVVVVVVVIAGSGHGGCRGEDEDGLRVAKRLCSSREEEEKKQNGVPPRQRT